MFDKQKFAKRLKDLREEHRLNQSDCAEKCGTSRGSISFYEKGERLPDIETIFNIAKYFNVSADYLVGITEAPTNDKNLQFICDYTGLKKETINFFAFQKKMDCNIGFYENTIAFIENLIANISENALFTININALIDDMTILSEEYEAKNFNSKEQSSTIIETTDEKEIQSIIEKSARLQETNSEKIEDLEDISKGIKYKLSRFLNEFLEEFALSGSGLTLKEFEELENNYYKS